MNRKTAEIVREYDPASGEVVASIPAPGHGRDSGLAWAEGSLWVGQYRARKIHRIDPATGAIQRTIESNRFVTGVTWADGDLCVRAERRRCSGKPAASRPSNDSRCEANVDRCVRRPVDPSLSVHRPSIMRLYATFGHDVNHSFKPSGYTTVSPYLIVSDARRTIAFLEQVFGAMLLRSFPDDSGRLMHAEVRIDDTVLMLADSTADWPPVPGYVHVYVSDVDAAYARALAAGAQGVQEPTRKDDEDRRGGVRDSGGTTWWIATRVG